MACLQQLCHLRTPHLMHQWSTSQHPPTHQINSVVWDSSAMNNFTGSCTDFPASSISHPSSTFQISRRKSLNSNPNNSPSSKTNSVNRNVEIFEKLRYLAHVLPHDKDSYQHIIDCVTEAMDAECSTPKDEKQTNCCMSTDSLVRVCQSSWNIREGFPDDLLTVDVSAFKHLIQSQPLNFNGRF